MSSKLKVNNIIPSTGTQIGISTTGGGINLLTGTVVTGIVTATTFSGSGASLTNLNGSNIASGTVPVARMGSGTANSSTFLRGDGSWASNTSTTINSNTNNYLITGTGTADTLQGESNLTFDGAKLTVTSSSKDLLYLNSTHSSGPQLPLQTNGTTFAYIGSAISLFSTGSSTDLGFRAESGKHILFGIGGNEKMRLNSSGQLLLGNATSASSDYKFESYSASGYNIMAKSTNGNGGYHNFTGQASNGTITSYITHNGRGYFEDGVQFDSTGEVLNSYEEGSWTPVVQYADSYSAQSGHYTKIGRMVYAYFNVGWYSSTGSHQYINNLPFTSKNDSGGNGGVARGYQNYDIENGPIYWVENNTTQLYFYKNNGSHFNANNGHGLNFRGVAIYHVA